MTSFPLYLQEGPLDFELLECRGGTLFIFSYSYPRPCINWIANNNGAALFAITCSIGKFPVGSFGMNWSLNW